MGDRASIMFKSGHDESPVLCAHWEGADFHTAAKEFTETILTEARRKGDSEPLYRLEPHVVLLEFIRTHFDGFANGQRITSSYYLGKDRSDVDDTDNGCLVVDLSADAENPSEMYRVEM